MKNENQSPLLFINYDEEKLKRVLYPIIKETLQDIVISTKSEKEAFKYVTISKGAELAEKSVRTIYNWIDAGRLTRFYIEGSPFLSIDQLNSLPEVKEKNQK